MCSKAVLGGYRHTGTMCFRPLAFCVALSLFLRPIVSTSTGPETGFTQQRICHACTKPSSLQALDCHRQTKIPTNKTTAMKCHENCQERGWACTEQCSGRLESGRATVRHMPVNFAGTHNSPPAAAPGGAHTTTMFRHQCLKMFAILHLMQA
jgi:hypothetical protein